MSTNVVRMSDIDPETNIKVSTGTPELDEVLDGGTLAGQVILVSGPPGVGKSTMMLQVADAMKRKGRLNLDTGKTSRKKNEVLYISSEEDISKIRSRGLRIKAGDSLLVCHNEDIAAIESDLAEYQPEYGVIDSLQKIKGAQTVPGALEILKRLYSYASATSTTLFITSQVNKDGEVSGSMGLEHGVDTHLELDRDQKDSATRVLRARKNRHGSEDNVGLFEMAEEGIVPYDPAKNLDGNVMLPGQAFAIASMSGKNMGGKSLLVEVQALLSESAKPQYNVIGYDTQRVKTIIAAICEHSGVMVHGYDVYVSILGGVNFSDTNLDAAIAMAIVSARKKMKLRPRTCYIGEVDLLGRIKVNGRGNGQREVAEKQGFKLVSGESLEAVFQGFAKREK